MSSNPSDITSCTYSTGSAERDGDDEEDEFEEDFPLSSFSKSEKSEESDDGGNEGSSKMKNENDMKIDSNGNKIGLKYNGNTTSTSSSSFSGGEIKGEGSSGFEEVHIDFLKSADASGSGLGSGTRVGGLITSGVLGGSELIR